MTRRRKSQPDFEQPPVVEVALSVQFEPLAGLRTPEVARLWTTFRKRYPRFEEQPPLDPVIEQFGVMRPVVEGPQLKLVDAGAMSRYWFVNDAGTELVQVQQDRFAVNWRRGSAGTPYPRYRQIRERFRRDVAAFQQFLQRAGIGPLIPNQGEVSYVDEITPLGVWERHGQIGEVLTVWNPRASTFLPEPENVTFVARYLIRREANEPPVGRLHLTLQPLYRRVEETPIFLLTMTARGAPEGDGIEGVLRFMDLGQEWIVHGFTTMTTNAMQQAWGRRDGN